MKLHNEVERLFTCIFASLIPVAMVTIVVAVSGGPTSLTASLTRFGPMVLAQGLQDDFFVPDVLDPL